MRKILCDVCKDEINLREDLIDKFYVWEFCDKCAREIRKFIKELRRKENERDN